MPITSSHLGVLQQRELEHKQLHQQLLIDLDQKREYCASRVVADRKDKKGTNFEKSKMTNEYHDGHLHSILIGNQVNLVWLNLLGFGLIALNLI